jgi:phage baseplate assembly protein W
MATTQFEVLGKPLTGIEIGATGLRELAQNVKMIVTTWKGTLWLDRMFGIDPAIIDTPVNEIMAKLATDVTNEIHRQEPRVQVVSVTMEPSALERGEIIPLINLQVRDGVLL